MYYLIRLVFFFFVEFAIHWRQRTQKWQVVFHVKRPVAFKYKRHVVGRFIFNLYRLLLDDNSFVFYIDFCQVGAGHLVCRNKTTSYTCYKSRDRASWFLPTFFFPWMSLIYLFIYFKIQREIIKIFIQIYYNNKRGTN